MQDASFDLWALAIILFEAITGQHPFSSRAVRPFDRAAPGSPEMIAFFERALALSPDHRFGTAQDFRLALMKLTQSTR